MMPSKRTNEISVFVDESGSFEPNEDSSRFYLICFVLHDQAIDISPLVANLESDLSARSLGAGHCVHTGPLIRREIPYSQMQREERKAIFRKMMAFVRKADICYKCFRIDKHFDDSDTAVHDELLQSVTRFLLDNAALFAEYILRQRTRTGQKTSRRGVCYFLVQDRVCGKCETGGVPAVSGGGLHLLRRTCCGED